jgi:hypothetical protein
MSSEVSTSTSAKILYRPIGLASSIVAGVIAGKVVKVGWRKATPASGDGPPKALETDFPLSEILLAAAAQGAVFAVVKALTQRGGAHLFQKWTGEWPGE